MSDLRVVLYFTKGLARIVKSEIASLSTGLKIVEENDRFFTADLAGANPAQLIGALRTVDDTRLHLAGATNAATAADFSALCEVASQTMARVCPGLLDSHEWSITMSARRPPWKNEPIWNPLEGIAKAWPGKSFFIEERRDVDLRIQADESAIHISVNAWSDASVKRRSLAGRPGALKPTVAAALVKCAEFRIGRPSASVQVYDPFCGTGTILIEAALAGHPIRGSDIDPVAVTLTTDQLKHLNKLNETNTVHVRDAVTGFPQLPEGSAIVSNLPWGKQIALKNPAALYRSIAASTARIVGLKGVCIYLTTDTDRLCSAIRKQDAALQIELTKLGLLGQSPTIVEVF